MPISAGEAPECLRTDDQEQRQRREDDVIPMRITRLVSSRCRSSQEIVRHVVTIRPADSGRTELTVSEFGYGTAEARDISRAGLEQCLDKMETAFRR
jgi:hypothetical protein